MSDKYEIPTDGTAEVTDLALLPPEGSFPAYHKNWRGTFDLEMIAPDMQSHVTLGSVKNRTTAGWICDAIGHYLEDLGR